MRTMTGGATTRIALATLLSGVTGTGCIVGNLTERAADAGSKDGRTADVVSVDHASPRDVTTGDSASHPDGPSLADAGHDAAHHDTGSADAGHDATSADAEHRDAQVEDATHRDVEVDTGVDAPAVCTIAANSYPSGTLNPHNACESCQPAASKTSFTQLADGTSCPESGVCSIGECVVTLASLPKNQLGPGSVAVDSSSVYWTNSGGGTVVKTPIGGGAITTLAANQSNPGALTVGTLGSVFWMNRGGTGSVMACPNGSCGGAPTTLAAGVGASYGIAVDTGGVVYWTAFSQGTVEKCAGSGCGGVPTTLATGQGEPSGIVVDAQKNVYWVAFSGNNVLACPAGRNCSTSSPITLASGQSGPSNIGVDSSDVYWTNFSSGTVAKCSIGGCGSVPTTLATGQNQPDAITVVGGNVYWTDYNNVGAVGTVMKLPVGGGTPTTIAAGQSGPGDITADTNSVYWTNNYNSASVAGTVFKATPN